MAATMCQTPGMTSTTTTHQHYRLRDGLDATVTQPAWCADTDRYLTRVRDSILARVNAGDTIEIVTEDGTYLADILDVDEMYGGLYVEMI